MKRNKQTLRQIAVIPILGLLSATLSGCAKGPAGGPPSLSSNRLTINMTLQQAVNPRFFYFFAFDDNGNPADGPQAIIGTAASENGVITGNGVVTGSFRVLVQYIGGQFIAFRRSLDSNGQEQLERASRAFIGVPTVAGNVIQFTLDLDATVDSAATPATTADRLFVSDVQRLDFNFVTTSQRTFSPTDLTRKPFDALGFAPGSSFEFAADVDISGTRTYRNADTLREPTNDADPGNGVQLSNVELAQLDITDFTLDVRRSN